MTRSPARAALLVLSAIVAVNSPARANDPAKFRGGVDMVALDVCVRDRHGRPASALGPQDFIILENGVPQSLAIFATGDRVPLAVSLLVDASQSMSGRQLRRATEAAAAFISTLRPGDLVEVMAFNDSADVRFALGRDHGQAARSLDGLRARGMTALYQTILVSVRNLERAGRHQPIDYRQVVIVLSDGKDTRSLLPFDDTLEAVRRSGVIVYTISLGEREERAAPSWPMAQLAFDTGGRAMAVDDVAELLPLYREIGVELRELYRLGYVPSPAVRDGSWRQIAVRTASRDLIARTRSGYYAPRGLPGKPK
jgi:Ca-activated chloride channel family protein